MRTPTLEPSTSSPTSSPVVRHVSPPKGDSSLASDVHGQLAAAWMSRLQVLSVVATFLAGVDSSFLSLSTKNDPGLNVVVAILSGALIFHLSAAIAAFTTSFVLIHYQIVDVIDHDSEKKPPGQENAYLPPSPATVKRIYPQRMHRNLKGQMTIAKTTADELGMPVTFLRRCHMLCVSLVIAGFLTAATGVLSYFWIAYPSYIGAVASACAFLAFIGATLAYQ